MCVATAPGPYSWPFCISCCGRISSYLGSMQYLYILSYASHMLAVGTWSVWRPPFVCRSASEDCQRQGDRKRLSTVWLQPGWRFIQVRGHGASIELHIYCKLTHVHVASACLIHLHLVLWYVWLNSLLCQLWYKSSSRSLTPSEMPFSLLCTYNPSGPTYWNQSV